ncbi:helix-turn-helix domain-containing protein [Baekduia sp. Peel2402]|uniref:helix-turn-helix domain-containing protein n=1 Tax=Baekduia sp. Peel2402 TaxID=3458296 RepID=UPI00403E3D08
MAVAYRELSPPPGLEALVACVWASHDGEVRVLPDACVDVVFSDGRLVVAGPATTESVARATPGRSRVGVRFRVGAAGSALGLGVSELRDRGVALSDLWGRSAAAAIEDRVAQAMERGRGEALLALVGGIAPRLPRPEDADHEVRRAVVALAQPSATAPDVAALAARVGLSERQLRRRFEAAVGYGPATLARVLRFQRFLRAADAEGDDADAPLARLAADAGYADQAHLAREVRRLAGQPPSELLAAGAGPAGEKPPGS